MPIVFLLIAILFFSFFSASFVSVIADNLRSQKMLESEAVFLAASSGTSVLELNEGRFVAAASKKLPSSDLFFGPYELAGGEVRLDQSMDYFRLDYCEKNANCPELIVEWIEYGERVTVQSLMTLKDKKAWPEKTGPCMDLPDVGIKRCAIRTGQIGINQLSVSDQSGNYQKLLRFQPFFATGKKYLFHFKTIDGSSMMVELSGEKSGKRVGIPGLFTEQDSMGKVQNISRRIRYQKQSFFGLQERLRYAHNAEEMALK